MKTIKKRITVKKPKIVLNDEVVEKPEEITIEEVTTVKVDSNIVLTGKINQGKREFKNLETGSTYYEG